MNQVTVRRHRCEGSVGSDGMPCVGSIDLPTTEIVDVRLEASVRVNALAAMARSNVRYHVVQHELRLLLSYIHASRRRKIRLRRPEFTASALHIRRFVSESFGLAMLTAVKEWTRGWRARRRAIANFDALPTNLLDNFDKPAYGRICSSDCRQATSLERREAARDGLRIKSSRSSGVDSTICSDGPRNTKIMPLS